MTVERAQFINIRGELEEGLLRVVPPVPGRARGDLPREVVAGPTDHVQPAARVAPENADSSRAAAGSNRRGRAQG